MRQTKTKSSMPKHPALRGKKWTTALINRVLGRWVLVGWLDAPAKPMLVVGGTCGELEAVRWFKKGELITEPIDNPGQIIDIGPRLESSPYRYSRGEWTVETIW